MERTKRLNLSKVKKQELLKWIENRKKEPPRKSLKWVKEQQEMWKKYRERLDDDDMNEIKMKLLEIKPERETKVEVDITKDDDDLKLTLGLDTVKSLKGRLNSN